MTEFFLRVAEMPTSNFLACKSIFYLFEHHKDEYFSQPCRDIHVCEKKNLCRDESTMGYIEILGSLYMKPVGKLTYIKLKKLILLCGQIYLNV